MSTRENTAATHPNADMSLPEQPFGSGRKTDRADGRSDVWDELMAEHGQSPDAYRHQSSHDKWDYTTNLVAGVTEAVAVGVILDTALNVPGSGLNLYGTPMPGAEEAVGGATEVATGLLGSIFNA
jgi:hypothetical protein